MISRINHDSRVRENSEVAINYPDISTHPIQLVYYLVGQIAFHETWALFHGLVQNM